jgi:hypothetical protein
MATDSELGNGLLDEINDSMFKDLPYDRELNQAEWQELYDQLRLLSGRYRTPFPSAPPCRYYREGLKTLRELELTRWKNKECKLSEDELGILTRHSLKVYKLHLINLMAYGTVVFSDASSLSWKLPRFHEMVQMVWEDCIVQAKAPVNSYNRVDKDSIQEFEDLLASWGKSEDEGGKSSALKSLQQFLRRQGLPDSPLVLLDRVKQDTRSTLDGSTLQSVLGTESISSIETSWSAQTKEKIRGYLSGSSGSSTKGTASFFERVTLDRPET